MLSAMGSIFFMKMFAGADYCCIFALTKKEVISEGKRSGSSAG